MPPKQIVPGLYAIPAGPVNTFLIDTPDGCTLIDAGFPGKADTILGAVRSLGKQPSDIRHIVVTHAHPDHIGSLAALKEATGAPAYIHPLDAPIAAAGRGFRPVRPAPGLLRHLMFRAFVRMGQTVPPATAEFHVRDGDVLPVAPGGLKALAAPGHCAGQLAFLWPQHGGVLFAADACSSMLGLGWSICYEDFDAGRRSLARLAAQNFEVACFGHGGAIRGGAAARFRAKWGAGR
jgi:glyoxylase-like metal-dependent hydrolase (beta-lactamase superfamily II)